MILIRYDEIGIKGNNRPEFERQLMRNIRLQAGQAGVEVKALKIKQGRILLDAETENFLQRVFGISSYSNAVSASNWEELLSAVDEVSVKGSFRISCQRLNKQFPKKSPEVERELGARVQERTKAEVKLNNPGTNIGVEIIENRFYVFLERRKGPGGLPVGCEGTVHVEGADAQLCALLLMKRGCSVVSPCKMDFAQKFSPFVITNAQAFASAFSDFLPEKQALYPLAFVPGQERELLMQQFRG